MKKLWEKIKPYLPNKEWFKREFTLHHPLEFFMWGTRAVYGTWIAMTFIPILIYRLPIERSDYIFAVSTALLWYVMYVILDIASSSDRHFWRDLFFKSQELVHMYAEQHEEIITKLREAVETVEKSEELKHD